MIHDGRPKNTDCLLHRSCRSCRSAFDPSFMSQETGDLPSPAGSGLSQVVLNQCRLGWKSGRPPTNSDRSQSPSIRLAATSRLDIGMSSSPRRSPSLRIRTVLQVASPPAPATQLATQPSVSSLILRHRARSMSPATRRWLRGAGPVQQIEQERGPTPNISPTLQ